MRSAPSLCGSSRLDYLFEKAVRFGEAGLRLLRREGHALLEDRLRARLAMTLGWPHGPHDFRGGLGEPRLLGTLHMVRMFLEDAGIGEDEFNEEMQALVDARWRPEHYGWPGTGGRGGAPPTMGVAKHWPYPNPENLPLYWIPAAPDGLPKLWEVREWPLEGNLFEIAAMRYEATAADVAPVIRTVWDASREASRLWPRFVSIETIHQSPSGFRSLRWPAAPWFAELLNNFVDERFPQGLPS